MCYGLFMSGLMENPFRDYRPPELSEVFSARGKLAFLEFKGRVLASTIKRSLLLDDKLDIFLQGVPLKAAYNCDNFGPFVNFANRGVQLDFLKIVVRQGLEDAIHESDSVPDGTTYAYKLEADYAAEDSQIAEIVVYPVPLSDTDL